MTRDSAAPAKPILVFRSYARSLFWLFLGMVVSFTIFGLSAPYWNKAMANLLAVHEALLYNEGSPQYFLWYPAHLSPNITWTLVSNPSSCRLTPGVQAVVIAGHGNRRPIRRDMAEIGGIGLRRVFCHWLPVCTRLDSAHPAAHRLMASCSARRCSPGVLGRESRWPIELCAAHPMLSSALVFVALLLTCIAASETWKRSEVSLSGAGRPPRGPCTDGEGPGSSPALTIPMIALTFGKDEEGRCNTVARGERGVLSPFARSVLPSYFPRSDFSSRASAACPRAI